MRLYKLTTFAIKSLWSWKSNSFKSSLINALIFFPYLIASYISWYSESITEHSALFGNCIVFVTEYYKCRSGVDCT